ncbi:hypothetical protein Hanom_Chr16g01470971 [Helianthus anomalus]
MINIFTNLYLINYLHKLEEVRNLKGRFKDVEEAHDMLDLFMLDANSRNQIFVRMVDIFEFSRRTHSLKNQSICALAEDVMRSIKSIMEDYFSILHNINIEPIPRIISLKTQSAAAGVTSSSRNSLGSNSLLDEIIVGHDHDADLIRDKLSEDTRKLNIVSIVGMGVDIVPDKRDDYSHLPKKQHKRLMSHSYLIVIDDIKTIDSNFILY